MKRPGGFDGGRPAQSETAGGEHRPAVPEPFASEASPQPVQLPASPEEATEGQSDLTSRSVREVSNPSALEPPRDEDAVRSAERRLRQAERSRRARERRDRRRFTAHLRRRRRVWLGAAATVLALAVFVAVGVFTPIMAVREVQIDGASRLDREELAAALQRFEGVPLALVNESDVHRALEPFPLVQRYSIERIPPQTLIVRIEERDPVIALDREGGLVLVDPAGVLVGGAAERPVGVPLGTGTVIDVASPAFLAAARVIRDMPEDLRAQLSTVAASSAQDVEFTLAAGTRVVWGDAEATQRKSVVLRAMLASIGVVSEIDVSAPETPVFR